jgi:phosphate ABC transporter permease protein PstC
MSDRRAGSLLAAPAVVVVLVIVAMLIFVTVQAWPTLQHNGVVDWLGGGATNTGPTLDQQLGSMVEGDSTPPAEAYHLKAWPLIYATALTTVLAIGLGVVIAVLAAIFIVDLAPPRVRAVVVPTVRLLAAVPSVVYGLVGVLVLVPFVNDHLISAGQRRSVEQVIPLSGPGLLVAVLLLTLMVTPIMIALIVDALRAVPRGWREGAIALGVTSWRATMSVAIRAIRPAIVAAAVLASARALGEAIMLSMVSGSNAYAPRPWDGLIFLFEPLRPLAATVAENTDSINSPALRSSLYAMALLLLLSCLVLSVGAAFIKRGLRAEQAR